VLDGHIAARNHRLEVKPGQSRQPGPAQVLAFLVSAQHSAVDDLQRREDRLLSPDGLSADLYLPLHRAAEVDLVHRGARPSDQLVVYKDRRNDGDVHLVARAHVRVIAHEHVTGVNPRVRGILTLDVLHRRG
jgi:hypothetical protein